MDSGELGKSEGRFIGYRRRLCAICEAMTSHEISQSDRMETAKCQTCLTTGTERYR
mgnify:CR=1 FL=1